MALVGFVLKYKTKHERGVYEQVSCTDVLASYFPPPAPVFVWSKRKEGQA